MKRSVFLTIVFCFVLYSVFLFLATFQVFADNQDEVFAGKKTALGVSPAIVESIVGDATDEKKVTLFNLTNFPIPIKTLKQSFTPKEKVELPPEKLNLFDSSSWIEIADDDVDFILQPKEARTILMKIMPPSGASPGGHYAEVVFQPMIPEEIISKNSVFIFARVAVLFFIQKKGDIVENLLISSFKTKSFYQKLPIDFSLVLKNTGNTHLRPSGRIIVEDDLKDKRIGFVFLNKGIILPATQKDFGAEINSENFQKLGFGKYCLLPEVYYGTENFLLKGKASCFWLLPKLIHIIFLFLVLLMVLVIFLFRKRFFRAIKVIFQGN